MPVFEQPFRGLNRPDFHLEVGMQGVAMAACLVQEKFARNTRFLQSAHIDNAANHQRQIVPGVDNEGGRDGSGHGEIIGEVVTFVVKAVGSDLTASR